MPDFQLRRPVLLIILDGFGMNPSTVNNAVYEARTPNFDALFARHPHTVLKASGRAAGLPDDQMGNSEVGHLTLGSGAVYAQDLVRINDSIEDGNFQQNAALRNAMKAAKKSGRPIHLMGLVSDGGVHSHIQHLLALLDMAGKEGVPSLLHIITDGRDTAPSAFLSYLPMLTQSLQKNNGKVATMAGRYYVMDRDHRWDRTQLAFDAIAHGKGVCATSLTEAVAAAYADKQTDEFIKPRVFPDAVPLTKEDVMIFFNFRNDRPRQISEALFQQSFTHFERGAFAPIQLTTFTEFQKDYGLPIAYPPQRPATTLGEVISSMELKQFHCAETEKYAHVTFFFNGGREPPFPGEDRAMIPSPRVATYDLAPEMSAAGVSDAMIDAIKSKKYAFLVVNFANGDMVGHTAVRDAVLKAVETLDQEAGRLIDCAVAHGVSVIMTADHGNCDEMVDALTGEPHTQHSLYPVPCLLIDKDPWRLSTGAGLSAVAPTILELMGIDKPSAMTGCSLLVKPNEHINRMLGTNSEEGC